MPVDLARLRALLDKAANTRGPKSWAAGEAYTLELHAAAPALFSELESLRAEVERLRIRYESPGPR